MNEVRSWTIRLGRNLTTILVKLVCFCVSFSPFVPNSFVLVKLLIGSTVACSDLLVCLLTGRRQCPGEGGGCVGSFNFEWTGTYYVDLLSWVMVVGIVHYSVIIIIIIATAAVCRARAVWTRCPIVDRQQTSAASQGDNITHTWTYIQVTRRCTADIRRHLWGLLPRRRYCEVQYIRHTCSFTTSETTIGVKHIVSRLISPGCSLSAQCRRQTWWIYSKRNTWNLWPE